MGNCKYCNKRNRNNHQEKCWLNPDNMKIVLELLAKQMVEKSTFTHLHYGVFTKPIDTILKQRKMTSLKTIFKRLGLKDASNEVKIFEFMKYVIEKRLYSIDAFPPPLLYVLDGWHCYDRDEGQWRVNFALELENKLLGYE